MYQIENLYNYRTCAAPLYLTSSGPWPSGLPHHEHVESKPPTKEPCRYCKGTGKMTLFTSVVPCDQCGRADEASRLLRP